LRYLDTKGTTMQITLDTTDSQDLQLLKALVSALNGERVEAAVNAADQKAAPAPAMAKNATAAPKPTGPAPIASDEPAAEETSGATLEDAVAMATDLVSKGKAAAVKATLQKLGAERVSKLDPATYGDFLGYRDAIEALDGADDIAAYVESLA
jgi:hypothetical protein